MIRYDHKAYKTMLNGVEYRSRLEARWAAFFTVLKWRFDYEPLDLGDWSPDFVLHGSDPILVEVKPTDRLDRDVCRQMTDAANEADFKGTLLFLGLNPLCPGTKETTSGDWLGWVNEPRVWFRPDGEVQAAPYDPSDFDPCGALLLKNGLFDFGTVDRTRGERSIAQAEEQLGRPLSPEARAEVMAGQWTTNGHMTWERGRLLDYATVNDIHVRYWSRACNLVKWRP
jgi:hypothetical protein